MQEKEKLLQEIDAMNKKFSNMQKMTAALQSGFSHLQVAAAKLKRDQAAQVTDVKRDLGDMGASMRSYFGASIVGKLQVQ